MAEPDRYRLTASCTLILLRGDITLMETDAIVNAANQGMLGGGGVDGAIHRAAGPDLYDACLQVKKVDGKRCPTGEARITPAGKLPTKHVIHAVGPRYSGDEKSAPLLASAYRSSLDLANENGLKTVAFPAISCGVYGYPHDKAAAIALETCEQHAGHLREIWFVLFETSTLRAWTGAANERYPKVADGVQPPPALEPAMPASILDHPLIGERYFFPRSEPLEDALMVDTGHHRLGCYHEAPHGDDALTLVHFHGNGEVVRDYRPEVTNSFLSLGVNILMAEYRGYGPSTGDPALVGMFDDLQAILDATGVPHSRIVIFGRSIGSIYAIECVKRWPGIAGLVLESGIHDVLERIMLRVTHEELGCELEQLKAEAKTHLDHAAKLASYTGPLLVMHAERDGIVDVSHGRRNHDAAGSEDKKLVVFPNGTHNDLLAVNYPDYMSELGDFIGRVLEHRRSG